MKMSTMPHGAHMVCMLDGSDVCASDTHITLHEARRLFTLFNIANST